MDSHSRHGSQFLLDLFPQPISTMLEVSGLMRGRSHYSDLDSGANSSTLVVHQAGSSDRLGESGAEVEIRIIDEQEQVQFEDGTSGPTSMLPVRISTGEPGPSPLSSPRLSEVDEALEHSQTNPRDGTSPRYDFQPLARWIEQILPFIILLLLVFIRQHLQGLAVTFWVTAVMVKANDLLRKQTALKGERKKLIIISTAAVLVLHVVGIYWWYNTDGIWRPLVLLPPRKLPKFWHAVFTVVLNDVMVRQAGMAIKCSVLLTYKTTRGRHFRRQGQLLTLVEYLLLLYRSLIPGPVWYRFFLNKEYGNLFSSLTTGLYLTLKLTSVFEKVQAFISALRPLSRCEVQYGTHATADEVLVAGDMCAICQEKMHVPIALRCKHIFCEDCVSEWFERERTCPLCRAVVKSADLKSFGDGSTSLFIQFF